MSTISLPGAARRTAGLARRHKVITAVTALFIAAIIAVSLATSGSPAPNYPAAATFKLPVLGDTGKQLSLSQYAGKPVIVNFFASWCEPCQTETPLLANWYTQQHGKVALVGLDENDTTANAQKVLTAKGVSYPIGFDPATVAASAYGVTALPQTFFLNAQHRIVDHLYGAVTKAQLAKGISLMNASG
jgi:cytochrome c biogenesis protein CcmG/thiol:disulfide interchange protein DsbE